MDSILKRTSIEFMKTALLIKIKDMHDDDYFGYIRDVGDDGIAIETNDRIHVFPFSAITYISIKN